MPMPHQTNYQWKPNDNGAITNIRYDIEAEKWVNSINKATSKAKPTDWGADFQFIGAAFSLIPIILFMLLCIPIFFIKYVVGFNIKIFPGDEPTGWQDKRSSYEKLDDRIAVIKAESKTRGNSGKKRKTTWEDLTPEEQRTVRFVQAETAKAKAKMKNDNN
jgi:hypothetical protein